MTIEVELDGRAVEALERMAAEANAPLPFIVQVACHNLIACWAAQRRTTELVDRGDGTWEVPTGLAPLDRRERG